MGDLPENGPSVLARLVNAEKAKLIALGYPWPEYLEDKGLVWLDSEIAAVSAKSSQHPRGD